MLQLVSMGTSKFTSPCVFLLSPIQSIVESISLTAIICSPSIDSRADGQRRNTATESANVANDGTFNGSAPTAVNQVVTSGGTNREPTTSPPSAPVTKDSTTVSAMTNVAAPRFIPPVYKVVATAPLPMDNDARPREQDRFAGVLPWNADIPSEFVNHVASIGPGGFIFSPSLVPPAPQGEGATMADSKPATSDGRPRLNPRCDCKSACKKG
jgi:hypothetical protein